MAQRFAVRIGVISKAKAWRHLSSDLKAREADNCALAVTSSRRGEVLERSGRVDAGALKDIGG
jgi:hypothetical protein